MKKEESMPNPWYREPWPWFLMGLPAIAVVAGFITLYIAFAGYDGPVHDDYYKKGLGINQTTDRDRQAKAMDLSADLLVGADGKTVRIILKAKDQLALPTGLKLYFQHPTRSEKDETLLLPGSSGGVYSGLLTTAIEGRWQVSIEDERRVWRLVGIWDSRKSPNLKLETL